MLSNVGPEAGRAWCSVVRDTGVVESIPFNSAERFECWWEGFQQRGCRLATPSPGEASVSRLDKSTPLPSRIDSDVSATRTSAWCLAPGTPPRCLYLQSPSSCFPSLCGWGDGKRRLSGTIEAARRRKRSIRPASCRCLFICPVIHPPSGPARMHLAFSTPTIRQDGLYAPRQEGGGGCLTAHDIISNHQSVA